MLFIRGLKAYISRNLNWHQDKLCKQVNKIVKFIKKHLPTRSLNPPAHNLIFLFKDETLTYL